MTRRGGSLRRLGTVVLAVVMTVVWAPVADASVPGSTDAASSLPPVLPALQQWNAGSGSGYAWSATGRVVVSTADASALSDDAHTFATDLGMGLDSPAPSVTTGTLVDARAGDVFLSLGNDDTELGTEGYQLTIAPVLRISARAATGAFWGTRTVLQLLRQSRTLPAGTVRDWPRYPVRGVSVDVRNFPMGWWFNEIRELSYLKLNEVMFYPENSGFTTAQLHQLDAFASAHHVDLIGQVNMPGHMDGEGLPAQYTLTDRNGARVTGALDLTNPDAVAWAQQQVDTYIDTFSGPVWHTGGDEYPTCCHRLDDTTDFPKLVDYAHQVYGSDGTPEDVYRAFLNRIDDQVHQHGKSMRMWNDDLFPSSAVTLNPDITVEYWFHPGSLTPAEIAANGNQLVNANQDYLYFDEHNPRFPNTTGQRIWEDFDPGVFNGDLRLPGGADDPHLSGLSLSEWDSGEAPAALEADFQPLNRALAQKAWGSPELYPTWAQMQPVLTAIGRAPGFVQTPASGDPGAASLPSSSAIVFGNSQNYFAVQPDGSLRHAWWVPGSAVHTEQIAPAGTVAGTPTAYVSNGQQHVFARGTNGHLLHWWTSAASGGWHPDDWTAKAAANGDPTPSMVGDPTGFAYDAATRQQHIFARGADGHLYHWWWSYNDDKVRADDWGGQISADPVAYAWGAVQNVFARGADGHLHHWWWQPSDPTYVQQEDWGGSLAAGATPAGFDYKESEQHVVARGPDGHLEHWWYDQWTGTVSRQDLTTSTGLSIAGDPAADVYDGYGGQQHLYFRDAATGHLDHVWITPGAGRIESQDLTTTTPGTPASPAGDPSCFIYDNAEQHEFALDADGHLQHWWWVESTNTSAHDTWY